MKNRLEFYAISIVALFFTFSFSLKSYSEEFQNKTSSVPRAGDPGTNESPFTDVNYDTQEVSGVYKEGTFSIDSQIEQGNLKKVQEVTAIGSQITRTGAGVTKDPKTASYVAASGSMLGATGALFSAAHYFSQYDDYAQAEAQNAEAASHNESEIQKIDARIQEVESNNNFNSEEKATKIAALKTQKSTIEKEVVAQKALDSEYTIAKYGSAGLGTMGLVSSAAMGWTASMQLEQGKQLAADQDYCEKHPNEFPRCTEIAPQGDNTRLPDPNQNSSVSLTDPGFSGQNEAGDEDDLSPTLASPAGGNGGTAGAGPSLGGAGLGSGSSAEGRKPAEEKKELDDIGGSGFSGDQTYESGGGNLDQLGSGVAASSATAPALSGFDINQFLPSNLREEEFGGFKAAKVNDKEKKEEGLVLGKESPSLFTRISKAHQKKAPEMVNMMKEVI